MDMFQVYYWSLTLLICTPAIVVIVHSAVRFIFFDWLGFCSSKETD